MKAKNLQQIKLISVVIPAFRQQATIQKDLQQIKGVLDQLRYPYEIIVVVDGFVDKTFQMAKKVKSSKIQVVGYQHNHGKGYAVRFGMANAKGNVIAFLDAGTDINPNGLALFFESFVWQNADIIVGSKLHPLSKVTYPFARRILSWGYRNLVHMLFGLTIEDTQVGIKVFRRKVLEDVLPRLLVKQYAFDIEILAVANYLGYRRIFEAPIELTFSNWSSITSKNFLRLSLHMLRDTCAVFYRLRVLHYYDDKNKRKWKYDPELNFRINVV